MVLSFPYHPSTTVRRDSNHKSQVDICEEKIKTLSTWNARYMVSNLFT